MPYWYREKETQWLVSATTICIHWLYANAVFWEHLRACPDPWTHHRGGFGTMGDGIALYSSTAQGKGKRCSPPEFGWKQSSLERNESPWSQSRVELLGHEHQRIPGISQEEHASAYFPHMSGAMAKPKAKSFKSISSLGHQIRDQELGLGSPLMSIHSLKLLLGSQNSYSVQKILSLNHQDTQPLPSFLYQEKSLGRWEMINSQERLK